MQIPQEQPGRSVSLMEPELRMSVLAPNAYLSALDQFPTMLWLLTSSGVLDEIGTRQVTILAPSEPAFREFVHVDFYDLMSNPAAMAPILRRHVILGVYDIDELAAADAVTTLDGEQLTVWNNGRMLMVDEVTLTRPTPDADEPSSSAESMVVTYSIDRLLLDRVGTP